MNYYDARQRQDNQRWDYTRMNDGHISPVGYCGDADHSHDTEQEARECFTRYLLDDISEESYGDWTGCEWRPGLLDEDGGEVRCDCPTKRGLTARRPLGHGVALCDEHRTEKALRAMTPTVGQICASD